MLLPACALVAPRPRRCSDVTCAAKSKKKAKAEFKPPPPELSRPIDVFSRRDSHAVSAEAGERAAIALRIGVEEKQQLLETLSVGQRIRRVCSANGAYRAAHATRLQE